MFSDIFFSYIELDCKNPAKIIKILLLKPANLFFYFTLRASIVQHRKKDITRKNIYLTKILYLPIIGPHILESRRHYTI